MVGQVVVVDFKDCDVQCEDLGFEAGEALRLASEVFKTGSSGRD